MSWESSMEYYRLINQGIKEKLGGLHSCKCLMYSVDFAEIETLQHQGKWDEASMMMIDAAERLERGGAGFIVICTNTMHKMADDVQKSVKIPLLHIADAAAEKIKEFGLGKVGLLGTRFTMEQDFYRGRLKSIFGIDVVIPDETDRQVIHDIIYNELCLGEIKDVSRKKYTEIIKKLAVSGAEGIILGCTEIPLLVRQEDYEVPLFDTTSIHAEAAVLFALQ
jgi:aspartate racemase